MAYGWGVSEREFMLMTPEYFTLRNQAEQKKMRNDLENQRFFTSRIMSMWSEKGVRPIDVVRFSWEPIKPMTVDDFYSQNQAFILSLKRECE